MSSMNQREDMILRSMVESYIQSGTPTGSTTLLANNTWDLSSATVRNVLKKLGDEGYLAKPHSSSGRVPTAKAYYHYVQQLNAVQNMSPEQRVSYQQFCDRLSTVGDQMGELLNCMGQLLSNNLDYTVIVSMPTVTKNVLKAIHLILLDVNRVLLVLMTDMGVSKDIIVRLTDSYTQDDLNYLSSCLTEHLKEKPIDATNIESIDCLSEMIPQYKTLLKDCGDALSQQEEVVDASSPQTFGISKMLDLPEFSDADYMKRVLRLLDQTRTLQDIFQETVSSHRTAVFIDDVQKSPDLKDCALLVRPLQLSDRSVAQLGILGPTRMVYKQVFKLLGNAHTYVSERLSAREG